MSYRIEKIEYEDEGAYRGVDTYTLYKRYDSVSDMTTIYDGEGNQLLTCTDSYRRDGITQLIKLLTEDYESCDEISLCTEEEFNRETKERQEK